MRCFTRLSISCAWVWIVLGSMCVLVAHAGNASLTVPLYFQANCKALTGVWQGTYVDPQDLFGRGQVWPVRVLLMARGNKIYGSVQALGPHAIASGSLWAHCQQGKIEQVVVDSPQQCGHVAPAGGLLASNMVMMYLPFENAMTQTDFLATLYRVDTQLTQPITIKPMPTMKTCH